MKIDRAIATRALRGMDDPFAGDGKQQRDVMQQHGIADDLNPS
jgi:hypothetical protein